jgi:hypothetical protein
VHRLDQINALKRANLFEFKSLTLKLRSKQIGPFKTVIRSGFVNAARLLTTLASLKLGPALRIIPGYVKSRHFRSRTLRSIYLSKVVALCSEK